MKTVADLMTADVRSIAAHDVVDNLRAVMHESDISAVPVLDQDDALVGIVTANDLVEDWEPNLDVEVIMSTDVATIAAGATATEAAADMLLQRVHHLVVTADGTPTGAVTGIISSFDLLRALAEHVESVATPTVPARHAPKVGDHVVIRGHAIGGHERRGRIVEVKGADGGPPYMVQWLDDPHDEPHAVLFFPGSDADFEKG